MQYRQLDDARRHLHVGDDRHGLFHVLMESRWRLPLQIQMRHQRHLNCRMNLPEGQTTIRRDALLLGLSRMKHEDSVNRMTACEMFPGFVLRLTIPKPAAIENEVVPAAL